MTFIEINNNNNNNDIEYRKFELIVLQCVFQLLKNVTKF